MEGLKQAKKMYVASATTDVGARGKVWVLELEDGTKVVVQNSVMSQAMHAEMVRSMFPRGSQPTGTVH